MHHLLHSVPPTSRHLSQGNLRVPSWRWITVAVLLLQAVWAAASYGAEEKESAATRLIDTVKFLASDEMEGRGVGTKGLDLAAEYVAAQFRDIGLQTELYDGTPYQTFHIPSSAELGPAEENTLVIHGPEKDDATPSILLQLGQDFNPLSIGGSGNASAGLVFVGYGITAEDWNYDDYAGVDVQGRIVVMIRKEPQQGDVTSVFNGVRPSSHASFQSKVENAKRHGAAAILMVNDQYDVQRRSEQQQKSWRQAINNLTTAVEEFQQQETAAEDAVKTAQTKLGELAQEVVRLRDAVDADQDRIVEFNAAGNPGSGPAIPVFFCRRSVIDPMIRQALGTDLASLEQHIDVGPRPSSRVLDGWTAECRSTIVQRQYAVKNVVGVLEGAGALADETIVIGAHYDHIGLGARGSLAGANGEVHNGADDNASGTAGIIEIARRMIANNEPSRRRLVFVAFAGEERGLLGSTEYVRQPPFPLDKTVAMINLDMIGRLTDNKLTIGGTDTAAEFDGMLEQLNQSYQFEITKMPSGSAPSDHAVFYRSQIPVLFFFTGVHADYHRPTDDYDKINVDGMARVTDLVADVVEQLNDAESRPAYKESPRGRRTRPERPRPYLGCTPDVSRQSEGVALLSVAADSPAEKGGLKAGDLLVKFGEDQIGSSEDLDGALRKFRPGDAVEIVVRRDGEAVTLSVTLERSR